MPRSTDRRLVDQSARALRNVADWLEALDTVSVDPIDLDKLGELIHAVDVLEEELS